MSTGTYNYLPENAFQLKIAELPNVSFYTQEVSLPTVSLPEVDIAYPGTSLKIQGNSIQFSSFDVTFIVDEQMNNYIEVFKWIEGQRYSSKNSQKYEGLVSEGVLAINTANSILNRVVTFRGMFPVSLSQLTFRTTDTDTVYQTCTVSFAFTEFDIK